jgi:type IV pilus assembly protein PilP
MKKILYITSVLAVSLLAGCSTNNHEDLQAWMKDQKTNQKGKIEPLPAVRTFVPLAFHSKDDPFKDRPLVSLDDLSKNKFAPDPNRRKEPLELYTLEQLKLTGTLSKDKVMYAMIKAPDGTINYVTVGNYIGSNYGQVISVSEVQVRFNERIKDNDEWKIKENHLLLD